MTRVPAPTPWLVWHRPNPEARLRLFCFPYAGGGALIFRTWPDGLPQTVEVCAVQPPGRETRLKEPPFTQLPPLVQALAPVLRPYLDKPFAFFGHSMGAIISFELARHLRREPGPQPLQLFVSGRRAPQVPDTDDLTYNLPEPEFMEELRRLNGTPQAVLEHPELMKLMIPTLRADFELIQTYAYTPEPPLDCPLSVYGGLQDEDVSREHLEGWREQTTAAFVSRMFPGDHFYLHTSQQLLLRTLSQELHQLVTTISPS
jgi:medium-chain acyl-[acyl-carrier-protein] hydrolase